MAAFSCRPEAGSSTSRWPLALGARAAFASSAGLGNGRSVASDKVAAAKGLKPMEVVGTEFNPDLHDAVTEIDAGEEMKGKVVAEVQKGYYLNDKIIRHAKVVVGR